MSRKLRQPRLFAFLAVGFGIVLWFASGGNATRSVVGALLFAALISGWLRLRKQIWRDGS